jgi:cyclic beta-1,2-glucan synthetase
LGELCLSGSSSGAEAYPKGLFLYLRDLDQNRVWSVGLEPVSALPSKYEIERSSKLFAISRTDGAIHSRMEICVAPKHDAELRNLRITNTGAQTRSLELTSYDEVVLQYPVDHESHPAFSKLFLQTEFVSEQAALLVRRRPRSPNEDYPYLVHAIFGSDVHEYESDRARFLGRRRYPAEARALRTSNALSASTGNVLDPIVSLRTRFRLKAGESIEICLLLGAASNREDALALRDVHASTQVREAIFEEARSEPMARETLLDVSLPSGDGSQKQGHPASTGTHQPAAEDNGDDEEPLLFFNGYGGFSESGSEYVIRLPWRHGEGLLYPPQPWINILSNENFGSLLSESGAGYTWAGNSRLRRLTPWRNDPVVDPHSEVFYVRDEDDGSYGSPFPGPVPFPASYEVRHGFGYTLCRVRHDGMQYETTAFVARKDPVRFVRIRVSNGTERTRHLSLLGYCQLVMGDTLAGKGPQASVETSGVEGRLFAQGACDAGELPLYAFADLVVDSPDVKISATADHQTCFAQQVSLELEKGARATVVFILGGGADKKELDALSDRYSTLAEVDAAQEEVRSFWKQQLSTVRISTPLPELDLMINGWLPYQTLSCRLWARSALYQSGGAFGFRDQLQDASSLTHVAPEVLRAQILLHAAHQFLEGDVLHWWHPPHNRGIRTHFVDDLIWLPHLTAHYVDTTGDAGILTEEIPFLSGPAVPEGEDEIYISPQLSGSSADLYEHCCRALDRSLATGPHGLPLFGTGDWNDGMNRVGRLGRGESTWMGFFLYLTLGQFLRYCEQRGDTTRVREYRRHRDQLLGALNEGGWDGEWYRRGFYDDGTPLGSAKSEECRIDGLAQAWSVLSGVAPPERAEQALQAADALLVSEEDGLIRLLTPPFAETSHDPGYIKGYVLGVRENGGQYTHAALWLVSAMARLKKRDRVACLLDLLNPIQHALTPEQVDLYRVEPYVVAADIYGAPPHVGRGGWSWYTGSSGWMSRVTLESLLGLRIIEGTSLHVEPCIPDAWPGFTIKYRPLGGTTRYSIEVENPMGTAEILHEVWMDGTLLFRSVEACRIPLLSDGGLHSVRIEMGPASA